MTTNSEIVVKETAPDGKSRYWIAENYDDLVNAAKKEVYANSTSAFGCTATKAMRTDTAEAYLAWLIDRPEVTTEFIRDGEVGYSEALKEAKK